MRRNIEQIEIQEPPLQELKKKKSCAKRSCTTSLGCIVIFIIVSLLLLKFTTGPKIKNLKEIPENFPKSIPVYDADNINKITFISGRDKNRSLEIIAFIPKLILSPIILMLDNKNVDMIRNTDNGKDIKIKKEIDWNNFWKIIKEPVSDHRDLIQIEWTELPAEPHFVKQYYETELGKTNFIIETALTENNTIQFNFNLKEIEGIMYIEDNFEKEGTDYVSLTLNIPTTEN